MIKYDLVSVALYANDNLEISAWKWVRDIVPCRVRLNCMVNQTKVKHKRTVYNFAVKVLAMPGSHSNWMQQMETLSNGCHYNRYRQHPSKQ
jgi:hypothetical protein